MIDIQNSADFPSSVETIYVFFYGILNGNSDCDLSDFHAIDFSSFSSNNYYKYLQCFFCFENPLWKKMADPA